MQCPPYLIPLMKLLDIHVLFLQLLGKQLSQVKKKGGKLSAHMLKSATPYSLYMPFPSQEPDCWSCHWFIFFRFFFFVNCFAIHYYFLFFMLGPIGGYKRYLSPFCGKNLVDYIGITEPWLEPPPPLWKYFNPPIDCLNQYCNRVIYEDLFLRYFGYFISLIHRRSRPINNGTFFWQIRHMGHGSVPPASYCRGYGSRSRPPEALGFIALKSCILVVSCH